MMLGIVLYITVPLAGATGNVVLFVCCFIIIVSMYGGRFSTVPAYLKDMFGTRYMTSRRDGISAVPGGFFYPAA